MPEKLPKPNMIFDCYENKIDIVLVKSISRFARNTVDLLETIKRLKGLRIEVIFHQEDLRTSETETMCSFQPWEPLLRLKASQPARQSNGA